MKRRYLLFILFLIGSLLHGQSPKTVLLESRASCFDSKAPAGIVSGDKLLEDYDGQLLMVRLHFFDAMDRYSGNYLSAAKLGPGNKGHIDRRVLQQDPAEWDSLVQQQLKETPPAHITVDRAYDPESRELSVTVNAVFTQQVKDVNFGIGAILLEDGITGETKDYIQDNYFRMGKHGPMERFDQLPYNVPASVMVYDHVARSLLDKYEGRSEVIPANPQAGNIYSHTYTITLPEDMNEKYVRVIGYLTDKNTQTIVNAGVSSYAVGSYNAVPLIHSPTSAYGNMTQPFTYTVRAHDPDPGKLKIRALKPLPGWLSLTEKENNEALLSGEPKKPGKYAIKLEASDGENADTLFLDLEIGDVHDGWVRVGRPGFSPDPSQYYAELTMDVKANIPYVLNLDKNDSARVYAYMDKEWKSIGKPIAADNLYGGLAIHPETQEPWLFLGEVESSGGSEIFKYTEGAWERITQFVPGGLGQVCQIEFNSQTDAVLAYTTAYSSLRIQEFNGVQFSEVGANADGKSRESFSWPCLVVDVEDHPIVLGADFKEKAPYSTVYAFDGDLWENLGGGLIAPDEPTSTANTRVHRIAMGAEREIYVAIEHKYTLDVYTLKENTWEKIATRTRFNDYSAMDLAMGGDGKLIFAYTDRYGKLTCEAWDGKTWTFLGIPHFSPRTEVMDLEIDANGQPIIMLIDWEQDRKLTVLQYQPVVGDKTPPKKQQPKPELEPKKKRKRRGRGRGVIISVEDANAEE